MRGVIRPTPGQQHPRNRSGDRSEGYAGGVVARVAVVAAGVGAAVLAAAGSASAQQVNGQSTGGQSATVVGLAQSEPMVFGLGLAGLFWLVAGLLALVVGLVLATRGARRPVGAQVRRSTTTTISNDGAGGTDQ